MSWAPACVEIAERIPDVVGLERDVVHRLASPCQEAPDRRVLAGRREQLDTAVAHEERDRFDALRLQRVAKLDARAEQPLVGRDRLVEISNGDAEVMDAADVHARDATGCSVAHGQDAHGADRLRRPRLRLDVREQRLQLRAIERLLLQKCFCDSIESRPVLEE